MKCHQGLPERNYGMDDFQGYGLRLKPRLPEVWTETRRPRVARCKRRLK
jgi:hypothetical protein